MSPHARIKLAWAMLLVSIVGWPISALTIFSDEPQGVLGLSWLAIILTAWDIIATADVRREQEDEDE